MQDSFQKKALLEIEKISKILSSEGFSVTCADKKLYNYEIIVNSKSEQVKVLVYYGKKGVKSILQGNPETKIYKIVNNQLFGKGLFDDQKVDEVVFTDYIGTDESGKGDYFGPLVVAAVYINNQTKILLEKIGVKDSKLFSDNNIKILETSIKKIIGDNFSIIQINPEKYNQLYESFNNLNKIMGWAHAKAIESLVEKTNCENVISDKFGNEKLINDELKKKNVNVNLFQTAKGERYTAVAAASILARAKVVDWFYHKSREFGYEIPKGGGEAVNIVAKRILQQTDKDNLLKMIKFHFKNSQSIIKK
ncbi:MAG: ribonuclease HIII [Ignavibacteriaceae bacterium]